jgi:hypothetical protein
VSKAQNQLSLQHSKASGINRMKIKESYAEETYLVREFYQLNSGSMLMIAVSC